MYWQRSSRFILYLQIQPFSKNNASKNTKRPQMQQNNINEQKIWGQHKVVWYRRPAISLALFLCMTYVCIVTLSITDLGFDKCFLVYSLGWPRQGVYGSSTFQENTYQNLLHRMKDYSAGKSTSHSLINNLLLPDASADVNQELYPRRRASPKQHVPRLASTMSVIGRK